MNIELSKEKEIVIRPAEIKRMTTLTVERVVDMPSEKKVFAFIVELMDRVELWSGDSYDEIGQWTDTDVINRIKEIYS
jgi:hypothetical protein